MSARRKTLAAQSHVDESGEQQELVDEDEPSF
jgi:hypothetical protein